MSTHAAFTESSLSPHRRKGREGKGREERASACIHLQTVARGRGDRIAVHRPASATARPTMDGGFAAIGGGR